MSRPNKRWDTPPEPLDLYKDDTGIWRLRLDWLQQINLRKWRKQAKKMGVDPEENIERIWRPYGRMVNGEFVEKYLIVMTGLDWDWSKKDILKKEMEDDMWHSMSEEEKMNAEEMKIINKLMKEQRRKERRQQQQHERELQQQRQSGSAIGIAWRREQALARRDEIRRDRARERHRRFWRRHYEQRDHWYEMQRLRRRFEQEEE